MSSNAAASTIQRVARGFLARTKWNANTSLFIAQTRKYQAANVVTKPAYLDKQWSIVGANCTWNYQCFKEEGGCMRPPKEAARVARNFREAGKKNPPLCFNMETEQYSVEGDGEKWFVDMEKGDTDTTERNKKPASIVEYMVNDTIKNQPGIHRHLTNDVDTEKVGEIFRAAIKSVSEKGRYKLANPHSTEIRLHNLADLATAFVKFRYYTGETSSPMIEPVYCKVSPIQPPPNPLLPRQASRSVYAGREKTPREKLAEAKAELARLQAEKQKRKSKAPTVEELELKLNRLMSL